MHSNHLIHETSPYLLQHAHNPVDWHPWSEVALNKAKDQNKPILVSIGYAACHWCHVMEKESFDDEATAKLMNEHFINIKVDREERPDLDYIYMDAVQAITGSGGWPLNVFLTPEGKPFYGGTYFPPVKAFNRDSWQEVLTQISDTFRNRRNEVEAQAENLVAHLKKANSFGAGNSGAAFSEDDLYIIYQNALKNADTVNGGFGAAPKFPQTFLIQYFLRYYHFTKNEEALKQAILSLDKMVQGGIYDQIGGGFSRYATDSKWLVPHFEKMLYDNALLIIVLSEAYQLTRKELYRTAIEQTIEFIRREMTSSEKGFYAALDADSEGEEGKFYVWSKKEIEDVLKEDAVLFCAFYNVTDEGNWEEKNILNVKIPLDEFANAKGISAEELQRHLQKSAEILLKKREQRVRPSLDDKILLSWNSLFNIACSKAYIALGKEEYRKMAIDNMDFLLTKFDVGKGAFFHTYKNGEGKYRGFLDDYSYLIKALVHLKEITGESTYLDKADEITRYVIAHFSDEEQILFYFSHRDQADLVIRKKEVYDGATPSGNAVMAENLLYLSAVHNGPEWGERAQKMVGALAGVIEKYPSSFGLWAVIIQKMVWGMEEMK